jgi:hypothetical protein
VGVDEGWVVSVADGVGVAVERSVIEAAISIEVNVGLAWLPVPERFEVKVTKPLIKKNRVKIRAANLSACSMLSLIDLRQFTASRQYVLPPSRTSEPYQPGQCRR